MKLQTKVLLILGSMWVVISIMMLVDSQLVLKQNYQKLENELIVDNIHDVENAFNKTLSTLALYTLAWAQWDDAYEFSQTKNKKFINTNFVPGTFVSSNINFFIFFDMKGKYFYGQEYDLNANKFIKISDKLIQYLERNQDFIIHSDVKSQKSGLLKTPSGYVIFSSLPVVKGDGAGPVAGTILMGYYLSAERIDSLAKTVDIGLSFYSIPLTVKNEGLQKAYQALQAGSAYYIDPKNSHIANGYILLKDVDARPVGVLKMEIPRSVYSQGISTITHYLVIVGLLGVFVLVLIWYLLRVIVLDRLISLSKQVAEISNQGGFTRSIKINGEDELGDLGRSINKMVRLISITQDKLEYMAHHDSLTGLTNRISFYEILNAEIDKARQAKTRIAVLFIDMDKLKSINDEYGHSIGDKIIQHNADILRMSIKKTDTVSRLAGDEFVICCPDIDSIDSIEKLVKRFITEVDKHINIEGNLLKLTFSIGISIYPENGQSVDELLNHADEAMYVAKKIKGNAYHFYSGQKELTEV